MKMLFLRDFRVADAYHEEAEDEAKEGDAPEDVDTVSDAGDGDLPLLRVPHPRLIGPGEVALDLPQPGRR